MKRTVSVLLSIVLIISILTAAALPASADSIETIKKHYGNAYPHIEELGLKNPYSGMAFMQSPTYVGSGFRYQVAKGKAYIVGLEADVTSINIPAKIGKYPVDAIGMYAFGCMSDAYKYKSVSIPSSVTFIDENAFSGCTGITKVTGGAGLTRVGKDAFTDTKWYKNQKTGVIYLGKMAIGYKGTAPAKITIKNGTVGIGDFAFVDQNTTKQTKIVIPASVKYIGCASFGFCRTQNGFKNIKNYIVYAPLKSAAQAYAKQSKLTFREYPVTLLAAPMILKFNKLSNGVKISFSKTKGAYGCCVFKKIGGKWKIIGKTTKTAVTDKSVKKGVKYYYTVRCIDKNGKYISKYKATGWWYKHS